MYMVGNVRFEKADTEAVWIGQASTEGPTVAILGGVHGDELTGIRVVEESLGSLSIETGTVMLILGNLATRGKNRFLDVNLNRSFRPLTPQEAAIDPDELPYEVWRAQKLLPYLDMADSALDLHDFTNPCKPFIICERNALDTARAIGAPIISFGWSKTEPGSSDSYMFSQGKEGLCYELGQKKLAEQSVERGHGAVARFLMAQGLTDANLAPLYRSPQLVQTSDAFMRTAESYALARDFTNFEPLKANELIAMHGGQEVRAVNNQVIIFPETEPPIGTEAFILGHIVEA